MKFPRMDWYPWDFQEDERVRMLDWHERAAYMYILMGMWQWADKHDTVDLPNNDWIIAGAVGMPYEAWVAMRNRLVDHPLPLLFVDPETDVVFSPRLRREYEKALDRHAKAVGKGRQGGRAKISVASETADPVLPPQNTPETTDRPSETSSLAVANPQLSSSLATAKPELSASQASLIINHLSKDQEQDTDPSDLADEPPSDFDSGSSQPLEAKKLAQYLQTRLKSNGMQTFERKWHIKATATANRLLRSGLSPPDVTQLIDWCMAEPFWKTRITSMDKIADLVGVWQQRNAQGGDKHGYHVSRNTAVGRHASARALDALVQGP